MPHDEATRATVRRLRRAVPFRPFLLGLTGGEWAVVDRPERIAFDPVAGGSPHFHVLADGRRMAGTFDDVAGVIALGGGRPDRPA